MDDNNPEAVDYVMKLSSYLDSSGGEFEPLWGIESQIPDDAEFPNARQFQIYIDEVDELLNEAQSQTDTLLDLFEMPGDGTATLEDEDKAKELISDIAVSLDKAVTEFKKAEELVAGTDLKTEDFHGDFGVYDSLEGYVEYVGEQVRAMFDFADAAETNLRN